MPVKRPSVLETVIVAVPLVSVPASETTFPSDSMVGAEALPVMVNEPPPMFRVAPVALAATAPWPRRLFTLKAVLSRRMPPETPSVLVRKAVVALEPL